MTQKDKIDDQAGEDLRRRVEDKIKALTNHQDKETAQLLYELRVHQIELEMQNKELRRAQHELEASRARYFDLYYLAPVGYCTIDKQGVFLDANLPAATQFGVSRGALVKQSFSRFIFPEDQDISSTHHNQLFATGTPQSCELRILRPDAATAWARLEANLSHSADGTPVCRIVISDITARKQMEQALHQSEEKYRTVADFTYDWEYWLGPNGDFLYCSPSCQRITGHSAAAFQKDPALLRALVHPDNLAAFDLHRQSAQDQKISQEFEFRIIRADGSIRWIWISHTCQPVYDDKGQFLGTRASNRDVTERKRLEAEVAKDRNLAALGTLAGGIAHDFNNLFQGILGNISLAKMHTEESSKAFAFLEKAEHGYGLATKLTGQLTAFATGSDSLLTNIQPSPHIRKEATTSLNGSGLVAELDMPETLWPINVDPSQFHEVIKQMVLNAKDAMTAESGGKLKIMAANETLAQNHGIHPTLAPGNYLRITFQDQGCGICREHLPRIFDPYFSTKERGCQKGMGLGLALCDTIIKKYGGAITVQSELGRGSTFHIYIPAVVPVAKKTETTKDQEAKGPRILLMDDDISVVQVTTKFLQLSDYRIDSTLDGDAAIVAYEEAQTEGAPYALVILDLTIPGGMGGKEVIAKLKEINPEVKAIVSSGYADDDTMTDFAAYGFIAACAKPYLLSEMKAIIQRFV